MDNSDMKNLYFLGNTNLEFIFIHGYTGGITDFADLPNILHREFNATVWCPLLPGHGTSIDELLDLRYEDLIVDVEKRVAEKVFEGKKVVLLGISFGAQAALYLASQYKVAGVVAISSTHGLRFPFNIRGIGILGYFKRKWNKRFTPTETELRAHAISYKEMLSDGFFISRKLRALVEANARNIHQPLFFIHSAHERLGNPYAISKLSRQVSSKKITSRFLQNGSHNMFFSSVKEEAVDEIVAFMKQLISSSEGALRGTREKASAVVAAYNEAPRIGRVLAALSRTPSLNEIIVIDDGSRDATDRVVRNFPKVRYIKNNTNLGKGASMDRGVKEAKNDVVFFCDADLLNFKPEHAEAVIVPVLEGAYDMFIGVRGNFMQRTVKAWALNSGERAIRKKIWRGLPDRYKHGYRIEAGLNEYVRRNSSAGLGWKTLDYSQSLKETKYGVLRGTLLRWQMNLDVLYSYASRLFYSKK